MKRTLAPFLAVTLLLITAHRLPAPFSEVPEATPTPKPKREAAPRAKPKTEATPKPAAASNRSLAGTWSGSAATIGTNETCFFVIKIANDEKMVLISWKFGGENSEFATSDGPPELATCTRFGNALSWSPPSLKQIGEACTDTLRLNNNGTASFTRTLTSADRSKTFNNTGTLSRQGGSAAAMNTDAVPKNAGLPTAKPVPGKPGLVFSPFNTQKYIDVSDYASGSEVRDPYSGKMFIVP
jgi:hypothetical protein